MYVGSSQEHRQTGKLIIPAKPWISTLCPLRSSLAVTWRLEDISQNRRTIAKLHTNVWQNTTGGDRHGSEQLVEFLVISNSELQVSWNDSRLLVIPSSVSGQLENLSRKVFQDGSKVDWSTSSHSLSVVSLSQKSVNTTDREGETSLRGS